jgi:hypothetical protein
MTDTSFISYKPRIKRYVRNNLLYDTAERKLDKVRKLADEDWLWTGESVYCICTHHVAQHCTIRSEYNLTVIIHCHGDNELCSCELFRAQTKRGSYN